MAKLLMEASLRDRFGQMADAIFVTSAGMHGPAGSAHAAAGGGRAQAAGHLLGRVCVATDRSEGGGAAHTALTAARQQRDQIIAQSPTALRHTFTCRSSRGWLRAYDPKRCPVATQSNASPTCPEWRRAVAVICNRARQSTTRWRTRWAARNRTTAWRLPRSRRLSRQFSMCCRSEDAYRWPECHQGRACPREETAHAESPVSRDHLFDRERCGAGKS